VGLGEEQQVAVQHGRGDGDGPLFPRKRVFPEQAAAGRVKTDDPVPGPAHGHSLPGLGDDDRGRVGSVVRQGFPPLHAGHLVEGADAGVIRAAEMHDEQIVLDDRRGRDAPGGNSHIVRFAQIVAPQDLTRGRVEAEQVSGRSQAVGAVSVHQHRGPRPGLVADAAVLAVVAVGPERRAGFPIQAMNPFHLPGVGQAVGDVHPPGGDGRTAVAAGDRHSPLDLDLGPRSVR